MLSDNILVLCNNFPDRCDRNIGNIYVKDQLKFISKNFNKVYVVIPSPLSISKIRGMPTENYSYDNVHIYFVRYLDIPPAYFLFKDLWVLLEKRAVLNLIQKNNLKFDIIHAHNTWRAGRIAIELKKLFGTPVVITEHTSNVLYAAVGKGNKQFIDTWNSSDVIVRVNEKDVNLFKNAGISGRRIRVIPNGFDPESFFPIKTDLAKAKLKLPPDKKLILTVGHLDQNKGYLYMLKSMKEVITHNDDLLYIIIGDGMLKYKLERQIKKLRLDNHVILAGGKPHGGIPLWMNACDLFVLPSLRESFGIVQIEAMACGKPVVATRNGGSEEIILNDKLGFLVEPADPEDLAEKILLALDREWDQEKILAHAEQYTWEHIVRDILGVYEQVLE